MRQLHMLNEQAEVNANHHDHPQPRIVNFRCIVKGSLRAFFDLQLASGMCLHGCALHESHGKYWVGLPAKPYQKDGVQSWQRIVSFHDQEASRRFQAVVVQLAREQLDESRGSLA